MAKRGENIYKRKDGRWEGRYKNGVKPDGKTKYSSVYGGSYSEVRTLLTKKRAEHKPVTLTCRFTFGELCELWYESVKNTVRESTLANYRMKLDKHILPGLGGVKYESLTVIILNDFVAEKLKTGLSAKYVCDICRLVKTITRFARRQLGYSDKAELLSLPRYEKKECQLLSVSQQNLLIEYLIDNPVPANLGMLISAATGMRIGELCALKWSDIDLEKRIITVTKTMQRIKNIGGNTATKIVITPPKSRTSERIIPIPEFILPVLTANDKPGDCYVMTGEKLFYEPRTVQYKFAALLKKLKLPKVNFHALRHMFATRCISAGVDVKSLSEILGHSSVNITLNRYVHSSMERKFTCIMLFSKSFTPSVIPS